jgi:ribosomal protein S18 acetylase RimI-like enzyme
MGVRQMKPEDLPQIMALENAVQLHPWPQAAFEQALRLGQTCLVYEEDGEVLGYGVADKGHGRTIAAKTIHAAGELYRTWFEAARAAGAPSLYAEIEGTNEAARARLQRFGFGKIGTRPSFYGPGLDAEVWSKNAQA